MSITMRKQRIFLLIFIFIFSLACQFLFPTRDGTVISACGDIVSAVRGVQPGEIPQHLFETGSKQGDEFNADRYFDVLTHISMLEGYALDYIYQGDSLGGYPLLYPRPEDQAAYLSVEDVPENIRSSDFREYVEIEDGEQGYFEFVVMDIMADQFYLFWHANYNDTQIVCNRQEVNDIVARVSSGDFGYAMDLVQQTKARALRDIEPAVNLTGDVATVQFITFTKWGGFYRQTYTISRSFPHTIVDFQQENIIPYDCGIMF